LVGTGTFTDNLDIPLIQESTNNPFAQHRMVVDDGYSYFLKYWQLAPPAREASLP
jgi:hypothetical protein